jgi:hypothetical protein
MIGISIYRCRIQAITASSTRTTRKATVIAAWNLGIRKGTVWPIPPRAVTAPQTNPWPQRWPHLVKLESPDSASMKLLLIPPPSDAANPRRRAASTKSDLRPMLRGFSTEGRDQFPGCWRDGDSSGQCNIPCGNFPAVQAAVVAIVRTDRRAFKRDSGKQPTHS